jgi:hypothetical protein
MSPRRNGAIILHGTSELRRRVVLPPVTEAPQVWMRDLVFGQIAALPTGRFNYFVTMLRRAHRGDLDVRIPNRWRVKRDSRDARTSLAVRDRDEWMCRNGGSNRRVRNLVVNLGHDRIFFLCPYMGIVFPRPGDGELESGQSSGLENMHVISRGHRPTRYLVENGMAGCKPCHNWFEDHPKEWEAFCRQELGNAEYDRLYALAHSGKGGL